MRTSTARPLNPMILALDIESSTRRTNPVKRELREITYDLVGQALRTTESLERPIDRGDGVLVLFPPATDLPESILLRRMIPALTGLLKKYNNSTDLRPRTQLRIRAVIHTGEVHYDGTGFSGQDLDLAVRLLDAPRLKTHLKKTAAPLALVASDRIYRTVIQQGHDGVSADEFLPLVTVRVDRQRHKGWLYLPRGREPTATSTAGQGLTHIPIPGAALSAVHQALQYRLAETEGSYDAEAGQGTLKEWMSAERIAL
jgi:class 3 adenylate cyclase